MYSQVKSCIYIFIAKKKKERKEKKALLAQVGFQVLIFIRQYKKKKKIISDLKSKM